MKKLSDKITRAAHIKQSTKGTSNEISFSVLDAARNSLDADKGSDKPKVSSGLGGARADRGDGGGLAAAGLGVISLFTLGKRRKPRSTPEKEKGLHLSSGEFVSVEEGGSGISLPSLPEPSASSLSSKPASSSASSLPVPVKANKEPKGGSGSKGSAWTTPVDEVARRKSTRKRRKALVIGAAAVAVVALCAVGINALVATMQEQQTTRGRLVAAIQKVEEADETLIAFDELVVSTINDDELQLVPADLEQVYHELSPQLDVAVNKLVEARSLIERLMPSLVDNRDIEAANQSIAAINARMNMVDSGRVVMEENVAARKAMADCDEGWRLLLEADGLARDAAALVTNTTPENVEASIAKTTEAIALFEQALACMESAQDNYDKMDLSTVLTYLGLRIDSLHCAIASDQAYLARDKETAGSKNDEYNALDEQAVALAGSLTGSPSAEAVSLLEGEKADAEAAYISERGLASSADTFLRGYLSTKQ